MKNSISPKSMIIRPRRLRQNATLREMLRETVLLRRHLVQPLFIKEDISSPKPIGAMPGIFQLPIADAVKEAKVLWKSGIRAVILFGIPSKKDLKASGAYAENGLVQKTIRALRKALPDLVIITDVCLCEYMEHGHCGIVNQKGKILNDPSVELIARTALSHAKAGADMVAPSDMMDGRVAAIRNLLDAEGFTDTPIMSYAVKYASSFYGPFREAAESAPHFGDRKTYQMDYGNAREALKEAALDEAEGADILMVKPALSNLDIISKLHAKTNLPLAAYQVSGEYSMICAASKAGMIDKDQVALEALTSIRRAGAQLIITYFAKAVASLLPPPS